MVKDSFAIDELFISCHEEKIAFIKPLIKTGNIPHAFLFSGLKGIGKRAAAFRMAEIILSIGKTSKKEEQQGFDLFGEPQVKDNDGKELIDSYVAEKIKNRTHLDLFILEKKDSDKKNISIDDVREIRKFLSLTPGESNYRVAIIDSIDDFNINSANAILKILEEPTRNTVLIILCHSPANLMPTIKSRCIEVKFNTVPKDIFSRIISENKIKHDIDLLYQLSDGSPSKAIEIIEKNIPTTLKRYEKLISVKIIDLGEVISIAKEIKENNSWKLFGELFLKNYTSKIIEQKNYKSIDHLSNLNRIIYFSEFSNMDIQDSLKNLTHNINLINN